MNLKEILYEKILKVKYKELAAVSYKIEHHDGSLREKMALVTVLQCIIFIFVIMI